MAKKSASPCSRTPARLRTITLEEHYASPAFLDGPGRKLREQPVLPGNAGRRNLIDELLDLGEKRIAGMDAAGIDLQVLSLTDPSVQSLDAAAAKDLAREAQHPREIIFRVIQSISGDRIAGRSLRHRSG